jgi:hypothetical protein
MFANAPETVRFMARTNARQQANVWRKVGGRVNGHHGRTQRTQRFNAKAPSCSRNMCGSASAPLVYWNLLSYLVVQKRLIFRLRSCANALILHLLLQWGQS